jgi:hypothetical protein
MKISGFLPDHCPVGSLHLMYQYVPLERHLETHTTDPSRKGRFESITPRITTRSHQSHSSQETEARTRVVDDRPESGAVDLTDEERSRWDLAVPVLSLLAP